MEERTALTGQVVLTGVLDIIDARSVMATAELSALQQMVEQSPGTAISQGSSLVIPDGCIVRVDVQTVVLGAGAKTGML
jgi:membrane glycosyltransferase